MPFPIRSPADLMAAQTHDAVLLVARVLLAYILLLSGFGKLTDIGGFTASLVSKGVRMASVLGIIAPCVEFFGGLAVLLGVKTRYAALLMFASFSSPRSSRTASGRSPVPPGNRNWSISKRTPPSWAASCCYSCSAPAVTAWTAGSADATDKQALPVSHPLGRELNAPPGRLLMEQTAQRGAP